MYILMTGFQVQNLQYGKFLLASVSLKNTIRQNLSLT